MTSESLRVEREFEQAASTQLQKEQGYYPAEATWPELDARLGEFDVRLVQFDTYGFPAVIVMKVLDGVQREAFIGGELREHYLKLGTEAVEAVAGSRNVRVSVVLIGEKPLTARTTRRCLRTERVSRRPLRTVGFYWASPAERRFQSGYRSFSFASDSVLNPCDPDPNIFTRLLRRGWGDVGEPPPADRQVKNWQAERSFSERLLERPVAVWMFLLVNLLVWYLTERLGGSRNLDVLIRCGAKVDGLIEVGQYWRLVTPTFLHAGYAHMFLNGMGLLVLGQTLERLYGSVRFVLIYVLCGVVAALASLAASRGVMVGASGAIFGIVGILVVYGFRHRRDIPVRYQAMFGAGLLPLVGLNVLLGVLIPQIDNAAHIGGLLAGAALGLVMSPRTAAAPGRIASWVRRAAFVVAVATVVVSGFLAVRFFRTYPDIVEVDRQFVVERRFGPVAMEVPATWTIRSRSIANWELTTSYCEARISIVGTDDVLGMATKRSWEHLREAGGVRVPPALIVRQILSPLTEVGRARIGAGLGGREYFPRMCYVTIPEGLVELLIEGKADRMHTAVSPGASEVLHRMENSLHVVEPVAQAGS